MSTTYRLRASEIDEKFLRSVKAFFGDDEVDIKVVRVNGEDLDETEFLMKSPDHEELLRRIDDVRNNRNIIVPDQSLFR